LSFRWKYSQPNGLAFFDVWGMTVALTAVHKVDEHFIEKGQLPRFTVLCCTHTKELDVA